MTFPVSHGLLANTHIEVKMAQISHKGQINIVNPINTLIHTFMAH